jgi:hypothetical protein
MSPSPISYPDFGFSRTTLLPKADLSGADLGADHLFHANLGKAVLVIPGPGECQRHNGASHCPLPSSSWIPACAGLTYGRASHVCARSPDALLFKRTRSNGSMLIKDNSLDYAPGRASLLAIPED